MSKDLRSAIRGTGIGTIIGLGFGFATLSTIGFARMTVFEGLLLLSCSIFGGGLYGSLIGSTGAFQRKSKAEAVKVARAVA